MNPFNLNFTPPERLWADVTPDHDGSVLRLEAQFSIMGCPMHVEAHEVSDATGVQAGAGTSDYNPVAYALGLHARRQTVTINGRTYAIFAFPYGA